MSFCVLMVDVRSSRKYEAKERERLQQTLSMALDYLNCLFSRSLVRDVVFSAGDEVQGLFRAASAAFLYYRQLAHILSPCELRAGIGVGGWETRIEDSSSTVQDGTAFHRARSAIGQAGKDRCYDLVVDLAAPNRAATIMANYPVILWSGRTSSQADIARIVELLTPIVTIEDMSGNTDQYKKKRLSFIDWVGQWVRGNGGGTMPYDMLFNSFSPVPALTEYIPRGASFPAENLRGLSYELAKEMPLTRQSIDRLLTRGNVLRERNASSLIASEEDLYSGGLYAN